MSVTGPFQTLSGVPRQLPVLTVHFSVTRPTKKKVEFSFDFWIDSGFTGDLKLPQAFGSRLKGMGLEGITELSGVASGSAKSETFEVSIDEILLNGTNILSSATESSLMCMGDNSTNPLIGLDALQQWQICLDLPREIVTIS